MSKLLSIFVAVLLLTSPTWADWVPGDGHKMHFPQLPDPTGWDVLATDPVGLADDWQCSQTGPVDDIHIWGSWKDDEQAPIVHVSVAIFSNITAGVDIPFSQPGTQLWSREFTSDQFTLVEYGTGDQGWYDPTATSGGWIEHDHFSYHQINIENIDDPFPQKRDEIYWLGVIVQLGPDYPFAAWGWKTADTDSYPDPYTGSHFMDDAVWTYVPEDEPPLVFYELFDPSGKSLDLAFVITPEPATLLVLALGLIPALLKRRRKA